MKFRGRNRNIKRMMTNCNLLFDVKELYESLSDIESKEIFRHRMNYFLFGDVKELFKVVSLSKKQFTQSRYQTFDEFIINYR